MRKARSRSSCDGSSRVTQPFSSLVHRMSKVQWVTLISLKMQLEVLGSYIYAEVRYHTSFKKKESVLYLRYRNELTLSNCSGHSDDTNHLTKIYHFKSNVPPLQSQQQSQRLTALDS